MKILLKKINIVNPASKHNNTVKDILIDNGIIVKIGEDISSNDNEIKVYDMEGKYAAPGFLDMHVHLREPGREDEETVITGCNGAAAGGFTAIACMPNTSPAIDSAEVVTLIKNKAKDHLVDVYPVAAVTIERKGETLSPMAELKDAGAVGFSDDGSPVKTASILRRSMEYAKMFDLPIIDHCEDESLANGAMNESFNSTMLGLNGIPSIAEDLTVMRDIVVAEYVDAKLHVAHISTKNAVNMVREAKKKGLKITAEATPHHFTFSDDVLKTYDTNYKMNPPLRGKEDVEAIKEGLKDGTIDCIASDHAPHSIEEKEVEFEYAPNGILGLETEVACTLTELYHKKVLTLEQVVEKLSINPRRILKVEVPEFKEKEKANITIFDVNEVWTYDLSKTKSKSKNSPFDKKLFNGRPVAVINNNQMFYKNELTKI